MGRFAFVGARGLTILLFLVTLEALPLPLASAMSPGWGSAFPIDADFGFFTDEVEVDLTERGRGFIAWVDNGNGLSAVWAIRFVDGVQASAAQPLGGPGSAHGLRIAVDVGGDAIAVWSQAVGSELAVLANRFDNQTKGWGTATAIQTTQGTIGDIAISLHPDGNATVVWSQRDAGRPSLWSSHFEGGTWTSPTLFGEHTAGSVSGPAVSGDPQGHSIAVWTHSEGGTSRLWENRFTPGIGWGTAMVLETESAASMDRPEIATDSGGNAIVVWGVIRFNETFDIAANRFDAASGNWTPAVAIETDRAGIFDVQLAVDQAGNATAVWREETVTFMQSDVIASRFNAGTASWGAPVAIENLTQRADSPHMGVDAMGNVVVIWVQGGDIWANQWDAPAESWGLAQLVETEAVHPSPVRFALAPDGNGLSVWGAPYGSRHELFANRFTADDGWGVATVLLREMAKGAHSPQIAMDTEGNAVLAWLQSDGTWIDVWARRFESGRWRAAALLETGTSDAQGLRLAVSPGGDAMAVWRQGDGSALRVYASRLEGSSGAWGDPGLLDTGGAIPQIVLDPAGNAIAIWWQPGFQDRLMANRFDPATESWGTPTVITFRSEFGFDYSPVGVDAHGNAIAVWLQFVGTTQRTMASRFDAETESWGATSAISSGTVDLVFPPAVAVNERGEALATWKEVDAGRERVFSNRFVPGIGWGVATPIETDNTTLSQSLRLAIDAEGNAIAVWPAWNVNSVLIPTGLDLGVRDQQISRHCCPPGNVWASRFNATTVTWGRAMPIGISGRGIQDVEVAVNTKGDAIAVWGYVDTAGRSALTGISANHYSATSGSWGAAADIDTGSGLASGAVVAMDPAGGAIAAWTQWDSGRYRIFANRFTPDTTPPDTIAPALSLTEPADGSTVTEPSVTVAGTTEPGARLVVNGIETAVGPNGTFSILLALAEGTSAIVVTARDASGNEATESVSVTYRLPPSTLEGEVQDTQHALDALRNELDKAREELDATNAALRAANASVLLLFFLQPVLVASGILLLLLYARLRKPGGPPTWTLPWRTRGAGRQDAPVAFSVKGEGGKARLGPGTEGTQPWPSRVAGSPIRLSSKERILLHLQEFPSQDDADVWPPELTQGGIAALAVVDLRHFSQYVSPLVKEGLVEARTAPIEGALQRKKVYCLTEGGRRTAARIRDRVLSTVVSARNGDGLRDVSIADILSETGGMRSLIDVVREVIEKGTVDLRS